MRIGDSRVSDTEWRKLRGLFPELPDRARGLIDITLVNRDKDESVEARKKIREMVREIRPQREAADPFFELQWMRAVRKNPSINERRIRNRSVMFQAYYAHEPLEHRQHFMDLWSQLIHGHPRASWVYEGWYDEIDEEPPDEREFEYEEPSEI